MPPRGILSALEDCGSTGVGGEDHRLVEPREALRDAAEPSRAHVGLPMHGGDDVRAGRTRGRDALARDRCEAKRRVGHHVAHDHGPSGDALGAKRPDRPFVGAEEERRQPVDLHPRTLLRHRQVSAAQPRLDVRDRDARGRCGPRSGEGRVRVAEDENEIRTLRVDDGADRRGQRLDVGRPQIEAMRRLRETEFLEEDLGELVVPVLAGVDDDLLDAGLTQCLAERRGLDELRPVADDGDDLHGRPA